MAKKIEEPRILAEKLLETSRIFSQQQEPFHEGEPINYFELSSVLGFSLFEQDIDVQSIFQFYEYTLVPCIIFDEHLPEDERRLGVLYGIAARYYRCLNFSSNKPVEICSTTIAHDIRNNELDSQLVYHLIFQKFDIDKLTAKSIAELFGIPFWYANMIKFKKYQ